MLLSRDYYKLSLNLFSSSTHSLSRFDSLSFMAFCFLLVCLYLMHSNVIMHFEHYALPCLEHTSRACFKKRYRGKKTSFVL